MSERKAFIQGLRDLATFLETHETVPLPSRHLITYILPAEFIPIAKAVGSFDKEPLGDYFGIERKFAGGITYRLITERTAVCKRTVVGKRIVPATPEVEEEIIEWECVESLLAD